MNNSINITEDNYFDIAEAIHTVLTLWHDGSYGYVLLCRSQFRPGMSWSEEVVEKENEYYNEVESLLLDDNGNFKSYDLIEELLNNLNDFIEER